MPSYVRASPSSYLRTETDLVFKTLYKYLFLEEKEEQST